MLLALPALASTGCSALITSAGHDLSQIETWEDAHKLLGEPTVTGIDAPGSFEEFHSRRKYSEVIRANSMAWGAFLTLGLSEVYHLPVEMVRIGRRATIGQTICVIYDDNGVAVRVTIEGCPVVPQFDA
jgi:hypothetical protein